MTADGAPVGQKTGGGATQTAAAKERTSPAQFVGEVRGELRKVVWPTREELINYSVVVFLTIVILTSIIAGLDYITGEGVLRLFDTSS
ncbi:MAG: preprotein translocase subunit SecE [Acidimicrobiales bacterium]